MSGKKKCDELKICLRKLPPNLKEDDFKNTLIKYQSSFAEYYFVQGKIK